MKKITTLARHKLGYATRKLLYDAHPELGTEVGSEAGEVRDEFRVSPFLPNRTCRPRKRGNLLCYWMVTSSYSHTTPFGGFIDVIMLTRRKEY